MEPPADRRQAFVRHLYGLHYALESGDGFRSAKARQTLARLRRSLGGRAQEAEAYDVVFTHDPPHREESLWLLIAGLFALYPQPNSARGRSFGEAMGILAADRPSAARRFTQLVSVAPDALSHYLRQAVQLLRSGQVTFDYRVLLDDLVAMNRSSDEAHAVRLRWARDYHRPSRRAAVLASTDANQETL